MKLPDYLSVKSDAPSANVGPTGFHWLIEGVLGGTPRPGIGVTPDTAEDVEALARTGAKLLITLNQNWDAPIAELAKHGIDSHQLRIADMGVPTPKQAIETCKLVDLYLAQFKPCVFHCRAGRGRTGTLLTAQLIYYGVSADEAIAFAKHKNPNWIESQEQLDFLHRFPESL